MTPDRNATNFGINSVACKTFAANQIDCIEPILTETQGLCVEIITTATLVLIVLHLTDPNAVECWYVNTSYRVGKQNVCISYLVIEAKNWSQVRLRVPVPMG